METKPDLRPCPFCGNRELRYMMLNASKINVMVGVKCKKCLTCGPGECGKNREEAEEKAAEAWNRRAEPENRVLTLEEAAGSEDPVWLETRKTLRVGGGFLISKRAAAERAAAERAAAEKADAVRWKLSEREERMIEELGSNGGTHEPGDGREEMAGE